LIKLKHKLTCSKGNMATKSELHFQKETESKIPDLFKRILSFEISYSTRI